VRPCIAITIYDHGDTIAKVVEGIASLDLPCLIVDDGSGEATRRELDRLTANHSWIAVVRHEKNLGRGAALRTAYRKASEKGYTHLVQIDADLQHDTADITKFLEASKKKTDALVLGNPIFDESIPRARLYGRQLSRVIVWVETLSMCVSDPLCGFRCVPLKAALRVLSNQSTGDRMDFDPEFVVRMVRYGVPVINIPTRVRYPRGGLSHFHMVKDNLRLARVYLRLACEFPGSRMPSASRRELTR